MRLAGSDTREAASTNTVRRAAIAAAFAAGPGWAAAFGTAPTWQELLHRRLSVALTPTTLIVAGIIAAIVASRIDTKAAESTPDRSADKQSLASGAGVAAALAFIAITIAFSGDDILAALALPIVPLLSGWIVGRAARMAAAACLADVAPAALGLIAVAGFSGTGFCMHLLLVASESGLAHGAGWTAAYALIAFISLVRARQALPADSIRISLREPMHSAGAPESSAHHAALVMDAISITLGANSVLSAASLTAKSGELIALVGANGSGKSTLLRIAAGVLQADSGRVLFHSLDVSTLLPEERASAGVAFVSGARPVFPDLTVIENLRVAAYRSHITAHSFRGAAEPILELVPSLAGRRKVKAGVLSGGEQRLLALAQALFRRPAILLADELAMGLHIDARMAVFDLLRMLAEDGVAVVAADHDLPALLAHSDAACLLERGGIRVFSSPTSLLDRPDLLPAAFLGDVRS